MKVVDTQTLRIVPNVPFTWCAELVNIYRLSLGMPSLFIDLRGITL